MLKVSRNLQPRIQVFEGVVRQTLACGKDVLMAKFEYKKGSRVPPHRHSYEQVTTILKGKQKIIIRAVDKTEEIIVEEGDAYVVPANFEHEQISLDDSITVDAWSLSL